MIRKNLFIVVGILVFFLEACGGRENSVAAEEIRMRELRVQELLLEQQRVEEIRIENERIQKRKYFEAIGRVMVAYRAVTDANNNVNPGEYAEKFRKIDVSGCPQDFRLAFIEHIQILEHAQEIIDAGEALVSDENIGRVLLESLWSTAIGSRDTPYQDAVDASNELKKMLEAAEGNLKYTYNIMEQIAVTYDHGGE